MARHPATREIVSYGIEWIEYGFDADLLFAGHLRQGLFHSPGTIADHDDEFVDAARGECIDLASDKRAPADVQKGFGDFGSKRQQALALPCSENDDFHDSRTR